MTSKTTTTKKPNPSGQDPVAGTYRLRCDLPPPVPDRRKRHDWRANDLKAGTLFAVRDERGVYGKFMIAPHGAYSTMALDVRKVPELMAQLEPVTETPSDWLRRIEWLNCAADILDALEAAGKVTRTDIEQALETYRKS